MAPTNGDKVTALVFLLLLVLSVCCERTMCLTRYNRDTLLCIGTTLGERTFADSLDFAGFPSDIVAGFTAHTVNNTQHTARPSRPLRKRGKRAGVLVRFRRRAYRPPLPSILLSNVQSLRNKFDELLYLLRERKDYRDCSIVCLTETWLDPMTPDTAVQPEGYTLHRADRSPELTGKSKGGGVCFYVNHRWCRDSVKISSSCDRDCETLVVKCVPFYLPREFSSIVFVGVYIHPHASSQSATYCIAELVNTIETSHPDSQVLLMGDFNHVSLSKALPRYKQQVQCATRKGNTLDQCYSTIANAYRAVPRAPIGFSDHASVLLLPIYRCKLKTEKPRLLTVKSWDSDSVQALQGCLECTNWEVFKNAGLDLDEYTDTVTSYVQFCEELCISTRTRRMYPNDKPWFSGILKAKVRAKQAAYRSGDPVTYKRAKYDLQRAIRGSKIEYRKKLEKKFLSGDARAVWQGMQTVTGYKKKGSTVADEDPQLPNKLNHFYSRFDRLNDTPVSSVLPEEALSCPPFTIEEEGVRRLFRKQNTRTHTHTHTNKQTKTHTYKHTHTNTHTNTHTQTHTHTHTHKYTNTRMHTHTHTRI